MNKGIRRTISFLLLFLLVIPVCQGTAAGIPGGDQYLPGIYEEWNPEEKETDTLVVPVTSEDDTDTDEEEATEASSESETSTSNRPVYSDKTTAALETVPETSCGGCILVETNTGRVIYEKNSTDEFYPASTTKVMTALLAIENGNLDDTITCSSSAINHSSLDAAGSTAGLKAGEVLTLREILYCLLLPSANEAACVIAEYVSGSVSEFVELMNQRAAELGCEHTHFANPHGLTDPEHYTTPCDMYCIAKEFAKHEELMEISCTDSITIAATNLSEERVLNNTNHLISTRRRSDYIYPYAKGIKTGYTSKAKHCLVSSAEKDGMNLICIVMYCPVLANKNVTSFSDSRALYEWAFENFRMETILPAGSPVTEAYVTLSDDMTNVVLESAEEISVLLSEEYDESLLSIVPPEQVKTLEAPFEEGTVCGEAEVYYDGISCGTVTLVTSTGAEQSEYMNITEKTESFFSGKIFVIILIVLPVLFGSYLIIIVCVWTRKKHRKSNIFTTRRRRHR